MTKLQGMPAFGFETKNWNAIELYQKTEYNERTDITDANIRSLAERLCDPEQIEFTHKEYLLILRVRPILNTIDRTSVDQIQNVIRNDCEQLKAAALLDAKKRKKYTNITKILSYIPVVGSLIGIMRLHGARTNAPLLKADRVKHIIRGSIEALSLGFLLIIPDLIVTLRHRKDQPEASLEEQPSRSSSETE